MRRRSLPVLAGLLFAMSALSGDGAARDRAWLAAGACLALAALFKYTLGTIVIALGVYAAWRLRRHPVQIVCAGVFGAFGFVAPFAVAGIALVGAGAWPAFIEIQKMMADYAAMGVPRPPGFSIVSPLATLYTNWGAFLIVCLLSCGLVIARAIVPQSGARQSKEPGRGVVTPVFVLLWLLAAYGSAWWQGKYFGYHLLPMVPPLAVLAAMGLEYLLRPVLAIARPAVARGAIVAVCAGALVAGTTLPRAAYDGMRLAAGALTFQQYWHTDAFNFRTFYLRDVMALVDHVRHATDGHDRLFVWSFEPMIYFLAERRPVSRFIFDFPLSGVYAPARFRAE